MILRKRKMRRRRKRRRRKRSKRGRRKRRRRKKMKMRRKQRRTWAQCSTSEILGYKISNQTVPYFSYKLDPYRRGKSYMYISNFANLCACT